MSRLIGYVVVLIVALLMLPAIARAAQAAVPLLLSVLVFLGIAKLAWPTSRRRR